MFLRLPAVWLEDDPEACAGNAGRYVQFGLGCVQLLPERREAGGEQENKLLEQAEEYVCDAYRRAGRLHERRLDDYRLHDPCNSSVRPRAHAGRNQAARDDRPDPVLRRAGRTHAVRQQMRADRHGGNGRHGGGRRRQRVAGRDGEDGVDVLARRVSGRPARGSAAGLEVLGLDRRLLVRHRRIGLDADDRRHHRLRTHLPGDVRARSRQPGNPLRDGRTCRTLGRTRERGRGNPRFGRQPLG